MNRPPGRGIPPALWALALAFLAAAMVEPALAGTPEAPEIQDPTNDHELSPAGEALGGLGEACGAGAPCFNRIDIVSAWIDGETATAFNINVLLANAPQSAAQYTSAYEVHATGAGEEVVATATTTAADPAPGDNVAAAAIDGNTLILTINKAVYGGSAGLTGLFVVGRANFIAPAPANVELASDRAPDADGVAYTFGSGGGSGSAPGDSDGDGLNDTCEQQYFGGLNSTANATGDADGDGLTNGQECALGTDPTKADTDGDGTNDKDDPAPTDPAVGGNATTSSSTSTSRSSTSRSTTTAGQGGTDSGSDGEVTDFAGGLDKLTSDPGYLGMSAGGFLAVLVVCIIGLAVRWSL